MDKLVDAIDSFDLSAQGSESSKEYSKAARHYLTTLEKLPDVAWHGLFEDPQMVLRGMNPEVNSIAYCFILHLLLHSRTAGPVQDLNAVRDSVVTFFLSFNVQQIRFVMPQFRVLLEDVAFGSLYPPSVAVELLVKAMRRIDPTGAIFTSAHLILARLAYSTNTIEPAMDVIDSEILFFAKTPRSMNSKMLHEIDDEQDEDVPSTTVFNDALTSSSVLEYQFIRSLIYISRRDWTRAQAALEQIITHPSKDKTVSKIMVEGHKKWILVGLLNAGKTPATPSAVGGHAKNAFSTTSAHYLEMAALFSTDKAAELKASMAKYAREWDDDGNTTLINEVKEFYPKWQIANLRRIYQQVPVSHIRQITLSARTAKHLQSDEEVVSLVNDMAASGMLKGELQVGLAGEESHVVFRDECEVMTEAEFAHAIAQSHRNVETLSKQYRATNQRFSTNQDYIKHVVRQQKLMEREGGADAGVGFDTSIEDEDLMTGVMSHV